MTGNVKSSLSFFQINKIFFLSSKTVLKDNTHSPIGFFCRKKQSHLHLSPRCKACAKVLSPVRQAAVYFVSAFADGVSIGVL